MSIFSSPLLLGFDQFEQTLERITKASNDGYPPYNIERIGPDRLRITLAVAGFAPTDLSVTAQDSQLVIEGRRADEEQEGTRQFLHRGIAARHFHRAFVLADGIEVSGAELDNGLLHIELLRPQPKVKRHQIAIRSSNGPTAVGPRKE
ncbi:MAG: Hsp20 family protein [Alphaproteobacteria bacterium]|nr:Hsp20 family protein [Alphaproteobacteria bacterium]